MNLRRIIIFLIPIFFFFFAVLPPLFVFAQNPLDPGYLTSVCADPNDCKFNDLVTLGIRLVNFLIVLSAALAALSFAWAGFLFMTSAGSEGQITKAKGIFKKVAIGFIIVLSAWLIVNTILTALVRPGSNFNLLTPP